jgi:type 2 lantibiotic biosynthesis protein LanM
MAMSSLQPLSDAERDLVARSLGLHERLRLAREHPGWLELRSGPGEADGLLALWERHVGGPQALDRHLGREGLDRRSVRPILGRLSLPEGFPAPEWIGALRDVLGEMASSLPPEGLAPLELHRAEGQLVLQHYWEPWVRAATRRLEAAAGSSWTDLPASVQQALRVDLLEDLAPCGRSCLMHALEADRSAVMSATDLLACVASPSPPRVVYTACVRRLLGRGAWEFLAQHPVVARQAALRLSFWVDRVAELLGRLEADRPLLARRFSRGEPVGSLVRIRPGLSDPHDGGRRVALVELEPGLRLIYKPRSVAVEQRWNDLLLWCVARGSGLGLPALEVCDRGDYGWVEVAGFDGEGEGEGYLERLGELLALVFLLQGTDLHFDNVVRQGDSPVLVDPETILTPDLPGDLEQLTAVERWLAGSVLRTGLLPTEIDPALDPSPLAGPRRADSPPRFVHINTDGMYPINEEVDDQTAAPGGAGRAAEPVCRGFRRAHAFLASHAEELAGEDGPLAPFRSLRIRLVLRETMAYTRTLHASRTPSLMQSGLAFSLGLERLAHALPRELFALEHEALQRGDIPRFEVAADGTAIHAGAAVVEGTLRETGWRRLQRALRSLSRRERERQVQCIACSMPSEPSPPRAPEDGEPSAPGSVRRAGLGLLEQLADLAILDEEQDAASWIGRHVDPEMLVGPVPPDLYAGQAGIALALAGAHAVSGDPRLRRLSLAALQRSRIEARSDARRAARELGPGAFAGVGGLIYAFVQVSRLLGEPALLDDAGLLLSGIDRQLIAGDRELDVIGGVAGLILTLRGLAGQPGFDDAAAIVEECARHLLRHASPQREGVAWQVEGLKRPLCGLSHGNAGIALALMEASCLSGDPDLRAAALAALRWERARRDDRRGNWPDLRGEETAWPVAWCHGAPGVALARLGLLRLEELDAAREDLALALFTTRSATPEAWSLCCGAAGLQDILLEIGQARGDAALVQEARKRAEVLVELAESAADGLPAPLLARPGLMTGLAGVGYALLRLEAPLPSVLSLA